MELAVPEPDVEVATDGAGSPDPTDTGFASQGQDGGTDGQGKATSPSGGAARQRSTTGNGLRGSSSDSGKRFTGTATSQSGRRAALRPSALPQRPADSMCERVAA